VDPSPLRQHDARRRLGDRSASPPGGLNVDGLSIESAHLEALLRVDPREWLPEIGPLRDFYATFGDSLAPELPRQLEALERRLLDAQRAD
jgi:phosphoenolpyruvate carboxykinase (GTP)